MKTGGSALNSHLIHEIKNKRVTSEKVPGVCPRTQFLTKPVFYTTNVLEQTPRIEGK
jgi:hypothetical protein